MNQKEIKELINMLTEKDIAEFEWETGKEKIRIRRTVSSNGIPQIAFASISPPFAGPPMALTSAPATSAAAPAETPPTPAPRQQEELHIVKSPIVGTFYEAPSPGAAPFVQVGDTVEAGQVLCIIEAMKLMNEIESDVAGVIEKRFVASQQPVEYGEALFAVRKKTS